MRQINVELVSGMLIKNFALPFPFLPHLLPLLCFIEGYALIDLATQDKVRHRGALGSID